MSHVRNYVKNFENAEVKSGLNILNKDILVLLASQQSLSLKDKASLAQTCQRFWRATQPVLDIELLKDFLQAVIDDNRETVKKYLDNHLWLLIAEPVNLVIESKLTWHLFHAESAINLARKRKQQEMLKIFQHYINKLPVALIDNIRSAAVISDAHIKEIPQHYYDFINNIIDIIKLDDLVENKLSKETENALAIFRNTLLPSCPVKLDDYFDIETLLYVAYKHSAHVAHSSFRNKAQRNKFRIHVIGFLQTLLTPELAKVFCNGLHNIFDLIDKKSSICERAESLKMYQGESFYRESRDATTGNGFDSFCDTNHGSKCVGLFGHEGFDGTDGPQTSFGASAISMYAQERAYPGSMARTEEPRKEKKCTIL